jgi:simple sugar transport system substrate-binding protein
MSKHSFLYSVLLCILLAFLLTGCAPAPVQTADAYEDFIVVGFSQVGAESDWRNANTKSMQEALSEQNGYRLIIDDAQQKQERQITAIRNFIHQGVDYIVLAPTTEKGWDTVLAEAKAAGIPVIIVDRMIEVSNDDLFTCWIGSDFLGEGRNAVRWMDSHLGNEALRIVHLQGNIGSSAQLGRTAGLNEGLTSHENWELVYRESGDFTQAKGQELVEALLADGIRFNVIFSENDNMAYGAIDALKNAGLTPGEDVSIISFDASRHALELVMQGQISYDVECNPLHGPRVESIIRKLESGLTPPKLTYVEETAFDAASISQPLLDSRGY